LALARLHRCPPSVAAGASHSTVPEVTAATAFPDARTCRRVPARGDSDRRGTCALAEPVNIAPRDPDDPHALPAQGTAGSEPDPAAGTRHQRHPARQT